MTEEEESDSPGTRALHNASSRILPGVTQLVTEESIPWKSLPAGSEFRGEIGIIILRKRIPDRDLTKLASCTRFAGIPDRDLTELASCTRFAGIPDRDLTELASCTRFAGIPDRDLTELASCTRFAGIHSSYAYIMKL
ncbi:hypothetical protein V6N11_039522 [Hibiscus sabdariffa]|uniref:Uncharacterized protein n=1 Tax=Hibiscus sabdariffa TaxID=183260 RepID=A0ABR2SN27_9ROSI